MAHKTSKQAKTARDERPIVSDAVDASKGIFPFGSPHPAGAELMNAGELGGGSYEESGRSGLPSVGGTGDAKRAVAEELAATDENRIPAEEVDNAADIARAQPRHSKPEVREVKGVLFAHRDSHP